MSSSFLLFSQRFGSYNLRTSPGVCRTLEPTRNFELGDYNSILVKERHPGGKQLIGWRLRPLWVSLQPIFSPFEFFKPFLTGDLSLRPKWQQVPSGHFKVFELISTVKLMASILFFPSLFSGHLRHYYNFLRVISLL